MNYKLTWFSRINCFLEHFMAPLVIGSTYDVHQRVIPLGIALPLLTSIQHLYQFPIQEFSSCISIKYNRGPMYLWTLDGPWT